MPRPYSNDLRQKIVETVRSGASCRQTAKIVSLDVL